MVGGREKERENFLLGSEREESRKEISPRANWLSEDYPAEVVTSGPERVPF